MKYLFHIKEEANIYFIEDMNITNPKVSVWGERFLGKIDIFLGLILQNPFLFPSKQPPYREAFIIDFPYLMVYEVEENSIVVYAFLILGKIQKENPIKIILKI